MPEHPEALNRDIKNPLLHSSLRFRIFRGLMTLSFSTGLVVIGAREREL